MLAKNLFGGVICGPPTRACLSGSLICVFVQAAIPDVVETQSELTPFVVGKRNSRFHIDEPLPEVFLIWFFPIFILPLRHELVDNSVAHVVFFYGPAWLHTRMNMMIHPCHPGTLSRLQD